MGVRIFKDMGHAVMYCSTTDWAFGPVFHDTDEHDAEERVEVFLEWLREDPRRLNDHELQMKYSLFLTVEKELFAKREQSDADSELGNIHPDLTVDSAFNKEKK